LSDAINIFDLTCYVTKDTLFFIVKWYNIFYILLYMTLKFKS